MAKHTLEYTPPSSENDWRFPGNLRSQISSSRAGIGCNNNVVDKLYTVLDHSVECSLEDLLIRKTKKFLLLQ
mgnify:CR=1 FL=1